MYMCVFIGQLISDEDTDWNSLAQSYELTGGLIRNAVLSAISVATKRTSGTSGKLTLSTDDLHKGAKLQLKYAPLPLPYLLIYMYIHIILSSLFSFLRGLLEMVDFERRIIPMYGLSELMLESSTYSTVESIINSGECTCVCEYILNSTFLSLLLSSSTPPSLPPSIPSLQERLTSLLVLNGVSTLPPDTM